MANDRIKGNCCICGDYKELSFEHVPPKKAFNNRMYFRQCVDDYWNGGKIGKKVQGGLGADTLCDQCNNNTGSWYGAHFVEWCRQGMDFLTKSGGKPSSLYFQRFYPLSVLKQVVVMFFTVNANSVLAKKNPDLVQFVLNKEYRFLDPKFRFYVYYVAPGCLRYTPLCGVADIYTHTQLISSEFSFPPFGYMMTIGSDPPSRRLYDITEFARFRYKEETYASLDLAVLPTHTPVPGDYRNFGDKQGQGPADLNTVIGF